MLPPRLGWGTIHPAVDGRASWWGMLAACEANGTIVQRFHSPAYVRSNDPPRVGARPLRFLDAGIYSAGDCLRLFRDGMRQAELGIVTGHWYDAALGELAEWLDLPRIAIVDVSQQSPCTIPNLDKYDGVWLQGVGSAAELVHWETNLAACHSLPIIGAQWRGPHDLHLANLIPTGIAAREILEYARQHWQPQVNWAALNHILSRRSAECSIVECTSGSRITPCEQRRELGSLRIAIAYDEAFSGYFPETLELLQQSGATLIDFSPLRNDCLPRDIDLVYFGDGDLAPYLPQLAENHCLRHRLRAFVKEGGRAIVEGGAAAYFCRSAATCELGTFPQAGILPLDAWQHSRGELRRVETTLGNPTWLGPRSSRVAGYQMTNWSFSDREEKVVRTCQGVVALPCSIPWNVRHDLFRRWFHPLGYARELVAAEANLSRDS